MSSDAGASDAPIRVTGTRTRSGNAMARTRAALLDAAQRSIERNGVKRTTMSEVATIAGVAKATLYNHFRTKDDVLTALVEARVEELGERAAEVAGGTAPVVPGQPEVGSGIAAALLLVTDALAASPGLRRLAVEEPGVLIRLAAPESADSWPVARRAAAGVLAAAGLEPTPLTTDLVLRHLVHQLVWPSTGEDAQVGARLLERGLRALRPVAAVPAQAEVPAEAQSEVQAEVQSGVQAEVQAEVWAVAPLVQAGPASPVGWPG